MPFEGLRKQWSEISLEKKLAMFVAPVFVAVASGILVPVLTGAFGSDGEGGGLEVVDLGVSSGEVADDPTAPVDAPVIDVTVRNSGHDVSVITGANCVYVTWPGSRTARAGRAFLRRSSTT
jgi:hypothetical protein